MKSRWSWCWVAMVALSLSGCGAEQVIDVEPSSELNLGAENANSELSGEVKIDGSSTVFPISEAAAHAFGKQVPGVHVTVGQSGTGGGFERFTVGETDISDASRPIKQSEFDTCKANKVGLIELPIAYDGLTFVVHKENKFLTQLTVDQLKKIFRAGGEPKKWNQVDARWPDEEIMVYAPGADSGTFDYFKEVIVGKDEGVSIRGDMSTSEDDNQLVNGVAGQTAAIGFFGAAYYFENQDKLRAVSIVNPETGEAVAPNAATIESGVYAPFSRPLFIYVNQTSLKQLEVKKFVDFYLEHAGQMAKDVGYVALPPEIYESAQVHLDQGLSGTHFLTADGQKRHGALPLLYTKENLQDTK